MMIRSYLRYVLVIEMISRRLTKTQKAEILEAYQSGDSTNIIAENYNCTPNTIIRTVKNFLSESEYILLKKNRLKNSIKNEKFDLHEIEKVQPVDFNQENSLIEQRDKVRQVEESVNLNENPHSSEHADIDSLGLIENDSNGVLLSGNLNNEKLEEDEINQNSDNTFQEIIPLISNLDFDQDNGGCRVYVNDTPTWFRSTARDVGNIGDFVGPFWLPEGTSISNMYDASRMNVIEFNTN